MSVTVVQDRLGPAEIKTTLAFYEHVTPTIGKGAARKKESARRVGLILPR